jgi:hypothetical protein
MPVPAGNPCPLPWGAAAIVYARIRRGPSNNVFSDRMPSDHDPDEIGRPRIAKNF